MKKNAHNGELLEQGSKSIAIKVQTQETLLSCLGFFRGKGLVSGVCILGLTLIACELQAQNVGIGEPFPQQKLHVKGGLRLDGDTLTGDMDKPATILHIVSNGGVSVKLDANNDGNERFTVKRGGPDLGSVVFEVTEAGNTSASGFGDFNGYGRFNGDFTISGDSRRMFTGENFDVIADGSFEIYLDADADNAGADFSVLNDQSQFLFRVFEDRSPTVYPFGAGSGQTGGIRLRELYSAGSNWIGIRAADALSSNIWLTLPTTAGLSGQYLRNNGGGVLSWAYPPGAPPMRMGADSSAEPTFKEISIGRGDSVFIPLPFRGPCMLTGQASRQEEGPMRSACLLWPGASIPSDPSAPEDPLYTLAAADERVTALSDAEPETEKVWSLHGLCKGSCVRLRCQFMCYK